MLPGKKYTITEIEQLAWRRRWLIVLPFLIVAIGTAVVSAMLPNRYRSSTTILIVPQRVPKDIVTPTVTQKIEERLQMISQQILSRTRLERIIQEFNLYERERKDMIMEDVIEQMRSKDVKINIVQGRRSNEDASAFSVSYESNEARTAMLVTERLASLFIKENLDDRSVLAEATNQFLEAQLEDARRRLNDHEKKLQVYRQANQGTLPTQLQSNLHAISTAQQQMQSLQSEMSRDTDRKSAIEAQAATLRATDLTPAPRPVPSTAEPGTASGGTATEQLEMARNTLKGMELRLTPDHPDVKKMKRVIQNLETAAEKEALQRPMSDVPQQAGPISPAELTRRSQLTTLTAEYQAVNRRLAAGQQEMQRLAGQIKTYQARVEATPERESELTALMRDYETLNTIYTDLLKKNESSKVSSNLERRQIGEQFRILDGARLPEKPISPDRMRMNVMGALAGLALGLGLVAFLEYRDSSLKSEGDVIVSLSLPVLALVPAITTKKESRSRRRRRLALSAAGFLIVASGAVAAVWKLHLLERWVG